MEKDNQINWEIDPKLAKEIQAELDKETAKQKREIAFYKGLSAVTKAKEREIITRNGIKSLEDLLWDYGYDLNYITPFYELHCVREAYCLIFELFENDEEEFIQKVAKYGLKQIFDKLSAPGNKYLASYASRGVSYKWYDEVEKFWNDDSLVPVDNYQPQ